MLELPLTTLRQRKRTLNVLLNLFKLLVPHQTTTHRFRLTDSTGHADFIGHNDSTGDTGFIGHTHTDLFGLPGQTDEVGVGCAVSVSPVEDGLPLGKH